MHTYRYVALIWICAITVLLRPTFLLIALSMGLLVLAQRWNTTETPGTQTQNKSPSSAKTKNSSSVNSDSEFADGQIYHGWDFFLFLLRHALTAAVTCLLTVWASDSMWYGRQTLSFANFIQFNLFDEGAENFGSMRLVSASMLMSVRKNACGFFQNACGFFQNACGFFHANLFDENMIDIHMHFCCHFCSVLLCLCLCGRMRVVSFFQPNLFHEHIINTHRHAFLLSCTQYF
jgi:hypothetical protein